MHKLLRVLVPVLAVFILFACSKPAQKTATTTTTTTTPTISDAESKEEGGSQQVGEAVNLAGDVTRGNAVYKASCLSCHGANGKGNVANPGTADGTVPPLNPMDENIASSDIKAYTKNVDLYIEHGSTPEGEKPSLTMPAFGDLKKLTPQQIADVIAYTISIAK